MAPGNQQLVQIPIGSREEVVRRVVKNIDRFFYDGIRDLDSPYCI
jgi:hypothetical protein